MADRYDQDMMLGYLEGDLSPARRALFERQLRDDPRLAALVEQMQQDRQLLRELEPQPAPDDLMDAANERIARQMLLEPPPSGRVGPGPFRLGRVMRWSALAALVVLSAGVVWLTIRDNDLWWPRDGERYAFDQADKSSALEGLKAEEGAAHARQRVAGADATERKDVAQPSAPSSELLGSVRIEKEAPALASKSRATLAPPTSEPTEPVHVQIEVTTDDAEASTAMLLAYAAETDLKVHTPASDGRIDLECLGGQLAPLLAQLNAPAQQSAQLAQFDRKQRVQVMHGAQNFVQKPAYTKLEEADPFVEMRRQWRSLLDQQVPLIPVTPVYDSETTLKVQVAVRQAAQLDAPVEADAPKASQPTP